MEHTKKCSAYLIEKPISDFGTDNSRPDKIRGRCKDCDSNRKPSIKILPLVGESQTCLVCNVEKDFSLFHTRTGRSYTRDRRCKECKLKGLLIDKVIWKYDTKKCPHCSEYKTFEKFDNCKTCPKSISVVCKECSRIKSKLYREGLSTELKKERKRLDYEKNKEAYKERAKSYRLKNKDYTTQWRLNYSRTREETDPVYKIKRRISALIRNSLSLKRITKESESSKILQCSTKDFKEHIESQFLNWMNWENYGNVCEKLVHNCSWDLDHIIPMKLAKDENDAIMLNHWSNFQPLCSKANREEKFSNLYPVTNLELKITIENDKIKKLD